MGVIGTLAVAAVLAYLAACLGGLSAISNHVDLLNIAPGGNPILFIVQIASLGLIIGIPATLILVFVVGRVDRMSEARQEDWSYALLGLVGGMIGGWLGLTSGEALDAWDTRLSAVVGALLGGFMLPCWSYENRNWLVGTLVAIAASATVTDCKGVAPVAWFTAGVVYGRQKQAQDKDTEESAQDEPECTEPAEE